MKKKAKIRLYITDKLSAGREISLNEKQAHYLLNVMKLAIGETLLAFDNENGEFECEIVSAAKKSCIIEVCSQTKEFFKCPDIWLLFAPVKKDQTDFIIQKTTELGASAILPIITARTIADKIKKERFEAQSIEACEQCRRVDVPNIHDALPLEKVLDNWDTERTLYFMDETLQSKPAIKVFDSEQKKAAIVVGPEGGFSEEELSRLRQLPFSKGVTMGKRILRAETAVAAALSCWQMIAGDWNEGV